MKNDVERDDEIAQETSPKQPAREVGALEALWALFSSMKTAIVLLLLLAAASIAGTIIEQNQLPAHYIRHYGVGKYNLFRSMGLTNLYHSTWYVLLLWLFATNLAVCSINRFGIAWRKTFQPKVAARAEQIANYQPSETLSCSGRVDDVAPKVASALRSASYRVWKEQAGSEIAFYAAKGRMSVWGPYLTHLSILVIFAGSILGGVMGSNGYVTITEGKRADSYRREAPDQKEEDTKLGFGVGLRKFHIKYDTRRLAHGFVSREVVGYKSDLQVYEGGKPVLRRVVDVNHPLTYRGMSFFQSSYGLLGFWVKVTAPNGESRRLPFWIALQDNPQGGQTYAITDQPYKTLQFGDKKLTVFVHNFVPDFVGGKQVAASNLPINPAAQVMVNERFPEYRGMDAWTKLGWLPIAKPVDYKGYTVTLDDAVDYTHLQVSQNPALPVIYTGFAMMLIGVFMSFYVVHKVVRVCVSPSKEGVAVVAGGISRGEPSAFDRDFARLRDAIN